MANWKHIKKTDAALLKKNKANKKAKKGWAARVKADDASIKAINDLTKTLNKDVVGPWKKKAKKAKKKPGLVKFKVNAAKLNTAIQAYIHSYLNASVMQVKSLLKIHKPKTAAEKANAKKAKKILKAMKKLVKKAKTKLAKAKEEEKKAAKKGGSMVVIIVVVVVALLVVIGVVVYCKKKKGGDGDK